MLSRSVHVHDTSSHLLCLRCHWPVFIPQHSFQSISLANFVTGVFKFEEVYRIFTNITLTLGKKVVKSNPILNMPIFNLSSKWPIYQFEIRLPTQPNNNSILNTS